MERETDPGMLAKNHLVRRSMHHSAWLFHESALALHDADR
jgi:hypothetical protein